MFTTKIICSLYVAVPLVILPFLSVPLYKSLSLFTLSLSLLSVSLSLLTLLLLFRSLYVATHYLCLIGLDSYTT